MANVTHREDYINWEDYFMGVALLSAKRSKDPRTQVGACIVNKNKRIVGVGYNGMPNGCSDDKFSWCRKKENPCDNKHLYVCHAEMNAIINSFGKELSECTIYVTLFPCNECAKLIIQSGIKKVIYAQEKGEETASRKMFDAAEVEYSKYRAKRKEIVVDLRQFYENAQDEPPAKKAKATENYRKN